MAAHHHNAHDSDQPECLLFLLTESIKTQPEPNTPGCCDEVQPLTPHLCDLLAGCDIHHELPKDGVKADAGQEHKCVKQKLLSLHAEPNHRVDDRHKQQHLRVTGTRQHWQAVWCGSTGSRNKLLAWGLRPEAQLSNNCHRL